MMLIAVSKAGYIIADDAPKTIADGLLVPLKDITWHFVSNHVSEIFTASEQEIIEAMKLTWKHLRIVMEPSARCRWRLFSRTKTILRANALVLSSQAAMSISTVYPGPYKRKGSHYERSL